MYVIARNGHGRPTLMHRLANVNTTQTMCGYDTSAWSRVYLREPLETLLCRRCRG